MPAINIPVSPGELLDKISILEIKLEMISDIDKNGFVKKEHSLLSNIAKTHLLKNHSKLVSELLYLNKQLWNIEDDLRSLEKEESFNDSFIELARKVYITNDKRASVKSKINELYQSEIREVKSYSDYN